MNFISRVTRQKKQTNWFLARLFEPHGVVLIPIMERILVTGSCAVIKPRAFTYTGLNGLEDRHRDLIVNSIRVAYVHKRLSRREEKLVIKAIKASWIKVKVM